MTKAPAWVDMCSPSAISAIEPHSHPPTISATIITAHSMVAAFQPRDHRFGHAEPRRQRLLRLPGLPAQFEQLLGALPGDRRTVVGSAVVERRGSDLIHRVYFANLRSDLSKLAKLESMWR